MERLFSQLSHALNDAPLLAFSAALTWGVLSILLSPCHLASIPLVVSVVAGQQARSARRALIASVLFAAGILITIVVVGVVTAFAGRLLGDLGHGVNYIVAVVFLLVGLYLLDVLPVHWNSAQPSNKPGRGLIAALSVGLLFGLAVGPCTFAYMAPMLSVTLKLAASQLLLAIGLLLAFAIGHCGVIVLAGASSGWVQRYLNWTDGGKALLMRRITGVLVLIAGLLVLWSA